MGRDKSVSRRALLLAAAAAPARDLSFHQDERGGYRFDTGVVRGALRSEGRSIGILPAEHVESGLTLTSSMGLFGIYRVFSDGVRYGNGQWYIPSEARRDAGGAVAARWPASGERPFEMESAYRWIDAGTLDLTITVTALRDLRGFEAFLASYFAPRFTVSQVLAKGGRFVTAGQESGQWQAFPRDGDAARLIGDGRWRILPNAVDWAIRGEFERPVALRRDPVSGLTVVMMSPSRDCFAVLTPHEEETHYSSYFSLFGRDVRKGETARARARLAVLEAAEEQRMRELHEGYARIR